jgi:hypothetical protein
MSNLEALDILPSSNRVMQEYIRQRHNSPATEETTRSGRRLASDYPHVLHNPYINTRNFNETVLQSIYYNNVDQEINEPEYTTINNLERVRINQQFPEIDSGDGRENIINIIDEITGNDAVVSGPPVGIPVACVVNVSWGRVTEAIDPIDLDHKFFELNWRSQEPVVGQHVRVY